MSIVKIYYQRYWFAITGVLQHPNTNSPGYLLETLALDFVAYWFGFTIIQNDIC